MVFGVKMLTETPFASVGKDLHERSRPHILVVTSPDRQAVSFASTCVLCLGGCTETLARHSPQATLLKRNLCLEKGELQCGLFLDIDQDHKRCCGVFCQTKLSSEVT